METPICRRHRIPMNEVDGAPGCFECPEPGCEQTADLSLRAKPADTYQCQSYDLRGEAHRANITVPVPVHWLSHIGIKWNLYPVPQSNASDDYSIMNGPAAPGGGGSKSGRRRKKNRNGGKKFTDSPWGGEGGTNSK